MTNKKSEDTTTMAIAVSQDDKIDNEPVVDSKPASFSQVVTTSLMLYRSACTTICGSIDYLLT